MDVAVSGDGQCVYLATADQLAYTCSDGNWKNSDTNGGVGQKWSAIACSNTSQYVTAVSDNGIFVSTNYAGVFDYNQLAAQEFVSVAICASGQYQIAASYVDGIFFSNNYGQSWSKTTAPQIDWVSVVITASGEYGYAAVTGGNVYEISHYGGLVTETLSPELGWYSLAVSADGMFLAGVVYEQGLYTNQYSIPTSVPSTFPSYSPSTEPTTMPSSQPTSQPSLQPHTSFPTSQPSIIPSSSPSSQPSSFPTYVSGTVNDNIVIMSKGPNSSYVVNNLGCDATTYVTATILVSYLDESSSGFITITAGQGATAVIIAPHCAPVSLCTEIVCVVNADVSKAMTCEGGGSIVLQAQTVNANENSGVDTLCTYQGNTGLQFTIQYQVTANPIPTALPTVAPTLQGNGNFVFEANPSTPIYVIVAVTLVFVALGVMIVRLRDNSGLYSQVRLLSVCFDFAMVGYHLTSEVVYIVVLFTENLRKFAILIIIIRSLSLVCGGYELVVSNGIGGNAKYYYKDKLHQTLLASQASLFSLLSLLTILDQSLIRYYPWKETIYTLQTRGFPDQHLFKVGILTKLSQLLMTLIVQIVVLVTSDSYLFKSSGTNSLTLAFVLLYLVSSLLTFVILALANAIRLTVGKSTDQDKHNNDEAVDDNPIHSATNRDTELTVFNKDMPLTDQEKVVYLMQREALLTASLEEEKTSRNEREALLADKLSVLEQELSELRAFMRRNTGEAAQESV